MSKKSIADYKAGRHYRCELCNKTCTDELSIGKICTENMYMGRVDPSKTTYRYFCSEKCCHMVYIHDTLVSFQEKRDIFTFERDAIKYAYKQEIIKNSTVDKKSWILYLKLLTDIIRFLQAVLDKKSEYELHELKLKVLHTDGIVLEEFHQHAGFMNEILQIRNGIEGTDLQILGNR